MAPRGATGGGQLRIIGGAWRGRKLRFRAAAGLRPTPDRVRETLFNWLGGQVVQSRCLDLFAGSGALGLEALSRGAAYCCFVDTHAASARNLRAQLEALGCDRADVVTGDALQWLRAGNREHTFHIAFLDPPFDSGLMESACAALESGAWLAPAARIYVESSARESGPAMPDNWLEHRDKCAGEVRYRLFVRRG